jgi:hypothetical protein
LFQGDDFFSQIIQGNPEAFPIEPTGRIQRFPAGFPGDEPCPGSAADLVVAKQPFEVPALGKEEERAS